MSKSSKYSDAISQKQKKAFQHFLSEDEELVLITGYGVNYLRHRFAYFMMLPGGLLWILGGVWAYYSGFNVGYGLLAGMIASGVLAYFMSLWLYHAHRYLLTTRRVIIKNGILTVRLTSALYDKITHIEVDQGLVERLIMGHGTIIINTAGGSKDEIKLFNVDDPIVFKNLLERLINRERERFGGATGPVVTLEGELVD